MVKTPENPGGKVLEMVPPAPPGRRDGTRRGTSERLTSRAFAETGLIDRGSILRRTISMYVSINW